jgi:hypothetical protein
LGNADPQRREAVEDAAEDEPGRGHRVVEGIAEEVVEMPVRTGDGR